MSHSQSADDHSDAMLAVPLTLGGGRGMLYFGFGVGLACSVGDRDREATRAAAAARAPCSRRSLARRARFESGVRSRR